MSEGWIKLHRKLFDNPLWLSEPFTRAQAWVDMIGMANHKDGFYFKRGIRIDVKRGQIARGRQFFVERWKWSKGKVDRFFLMLQTDQQIGLQKTNVITLITITLYDEYQKSETANGAASGTPDRTANGPQIGQQTDTYKNDKKGKNEMNDKEKEIMANAIWVLDKFNEVGSKKFQKTKKNLALIKARIKEENSAADFVFVIENKWAQWKDDSRMGKYYRPSTIFGTKFNEYLNEPKHTPNENGQTKLSFFDKLNLEKNEQSNFSGSHRSLEAGNMGAVPDNVGQVLPPYRGPSESAIEP